MLILLEEQVANAQQAGIGLPDAVVRGQRKVLRGEQLEELPLDLREVELHAVLIELADAEVGEADLQDLAEVKQIHLHPLRLLFLASKGGSQLLVPGFQIVRLLLLLVYAGGLVLLVRVLLLLDLVLEPLHFGRQPVDRLHKLVRFVE